MAQILDMKNAEKRVFRLAALEDGIWEIYLGLFFILMSIYSLTRELLGPALNAVLVLGISLLLIAPVWVAKKRITQPRIGLVKFGSGVKKKLKVANIIVFGLVLATLILWILGAKNLVTEPTWGLFPQWLSEFDIDLIFALSTFGVFCLIAYYTGVARFYLYGILIGAGNLATTILLVYNQIKFGWPIALAGVIIASIGLSVLLKFLQEHPLPTVETPNGQ